MAKLDRTQTSARLLRLLSILQARPDWTGPELAGRRLGITVRTLRREMTRLRDLGYPVHATPGVAGGCWRWAAGATGSPLASSSTDTRSNVVSTNSPSARRYLTGHGPNPILITPSRR